VDAVIDPAELTLDIVESLIDDDIGLDPNIPGDYLLGHQIFVWKRTKGRDQSAARDICKEYNARVRMPWPRARHARKVTMACAPGVARR
jgi:hypothetical protein